VPTFTLEQNATMAYNVLIKVPGPERIFFYSYLLPLLMGLIFTFAVFWVLTRRDKNVILAALPTYLVYKVIREYVKAVTLSWIAMSSEILAVYEAFAEQTAIALHSSLIWSWADYMALFYAFISIMLTAYMIVKDAKRKFKRRGR